jgi:nitrate reductase beta subunit
MAKRSVLFIDGNPLYVENIKRNGDVLNARVINGAWALRIKGKVAYAKSGRQVVNKWGFAVLEEVEIPDDKDFSYDPWGRDYNAAIQWAKKQRKD